MYGVPTSTSSRRAGKKGFRQEGAPNGHLAKIPRLWATTELSVGESGVLDWSGMVSSGGASSSQPRKILHSFQCTLLGRAKCTRDPRRNTSPSHTSLRRRPLVTCHTCTYTPSLHTRTRLLFPVTPSRHFGHGRQATRARSRLPPSRAQTETPTPWRLPRPGSAAVATRTGLSPQSRPDSAGLQVLARGGRVLTAQGPWEM